MGRRFRITTVEDETPRLVGDIVTSGRYGVRAGAALGCWEVVNMATDVVAYEARRGVLRANASGWRYRIGTPDVARLRAELPAWVPLAERPVAAAILERPASELC